MYGLEFRLLNEFQHDLPLCRAPYAAMGATLGVSESTVIATLGRLAQAGRVSRVGPVFRPNTVSASTLAAMRVPLERLEEVAQIVNACPGVSHNYARQHHFNLWFVAAAADENRLARLLDDLEARCGCPMLRLPLVESYHIDLGFDLAPERMPQKHSASRQRELSPAPLNSGERKLAAQLATGLALVPCPFAELAARTARTEDEVLGTLAQWLRAGVISRMGVIVRHHELGYGSNAMVAFDIPDALAADAGKRIAMVSDVTLCARRIRQPPEWPYNLYCMIHGRDKSKVILRIESLRENCGLRNWPFAILFSTRRFKQQAARIVEPSIADVAAEPAHG
jgi:siroheme decarboxylase